MQDKPMISVISPVYGCQGCLLDLYQKLVETLEKITNKFEIILVNDASPDQSWRIIQILAERDKRVIGIDLSRNFGQHHAITAGLDYASGEWIVVMDCDLQDQPSEIIRLYNKAHEGYDLVFARRNNRQDKYLKKMSSTLFYKLLSYLTDTPQDPTIANFGIYHRKVIENVKNMRESLRYFPVMVRWIGFKSTAIDIEHASREEGNSTYTFRKLLNLSINVMLAFSDKPLRLTVKLGLTISVLSFCYALYIIFTALNNDVVVLGWSSLIVSVWLVGGIIIFILGILGTYLGKTFDQTKKRPIYIVREKLNHLQYETAEKINH